MKLDRQAATSSGVPVRVLACSGSRAPAFGLLPPRPVLSPPDPLRWAPAGAPRGSSAPAYFSSTFFRYWPVKLDSAGRHLLRRARADDGAAAVAPLGTQVDQVVGALDDVQIVLDDHHGVAAVHQPLEHLQQLAHVVGVEAGGGLVQDIDGLAGGDAC